MKEFWVYATLAATSGRSASSRETNCHDHWSLPIASDSVVLTRAVSRWRGRVRCDKGTVAGFPVDMARDILRPSHHANLVIPADSSGSVAHITSPGDT